MGRMGLVGRPGCSDEVRIRGPRPPAPDDRTRSGTAPPPRAWRVAVPRTAGGRRSGWRRPAAGGSPRRGTRPGMTGAAPAGRRGPGQEVRGRLRNGVGRRETDRRAPGPACAVRARRDEIRLHSIRAIPPGAMRAQVTSPNRLPQGRGAQGAMLARATAMGSRVRARSGPDRPLIGSNRPGSVLLPCSDDERGGPMTPPSPASRGGRFPGRG